jgi:hypothetical protein
LLRDRVFWDLILRCCIDGSQNFGDIIVLWNIINQKAQQSQYAADIYTHSMCSVQFCIPIKGGRHFEHEHKHTHTYIKHAIINKLNTGYHANVLFIFWGSKSSKTGNGNVWITRNWNQKFMKTHLRMSSINYNLMQTDSYLSHTHCIYLNM